MNLIIAAWNANGLLKNKNELQVFLEMNNIDTCLISETHCTNESFFQFKKYRFYHAIHLSNSARRGSGVLIKENISHYEDFKLQKEKVQTAAITIKTKSYLLTVASIYCPPRHSLKKEHYMDLFSQLGNRFVFGGDFNAKNTLWGSRLTTTKGRELAIAIQEFSWDPVSTGKPTYWPTDPNRVPDLIDFLVIKIISTNYLTIEESMEQSSDHSPIILTLSEKIIKKISNPSLTNKRIDWDSLKID